VKKNSLHLYVPKVIVLLMNKIYKKKKITFVIATVFFTQISYNKQLQWISNYKNKKQPLTVFTKCRKTCWSRQSPPRFVLETKATERQEK